MSDRPIVLPALEMLDAVDADLPADRAEALGVALFLLSTMKSRAMVEIKVEDGRRAASDELITALLEAADSGLARRSAGAYRLTGAGVRLLETHDFRAHEETRRQAARLGRLEREALLEEADRVAAG